MTAVIGRQGFEVDAIDVFAGWGGSSQGIESAGATLKAAVNHNALALECHSLNFREADHWQADLVDANDPQVVNRAGKKVAGRYMDPIQLPRARFAWFSPSCTHHSQANSTKIYERGLQIAMWEDDDWDEQAFVNSERSRVTMSCAIRYASHHQPEILVVENVLQVTEWGPGRDGSTFKWWMAELRKLDYEVKCCFFNSMFFPPTPQSRDRIYVVAWRKGNTAPDLDYRPPAFCTSDVCGGRMVQSIQTWKRPTAAWRGMATWGKYGSQYIYTCEHCRAPVTPASWMALSAIDFSDLGTKIGERKRPLAPNTTERIRRAIRKFWNAPPVLLPTPALASRIETAHGARVAIDNGGSPEQYAGNRSHLLTEPLAAFTSKNSQGIATLAATIPIRSGRPRADSIGEELATIHAGGNYGGLATMAVIPMRSGRFRGIRMDEQLATVLAGGEGGTGGTGALVALVPNRTNNVPKHGTDAAAPLMTSATQGMVIAAAGNTYDDPNGYTRARHQTQPLFSQTETNGFGFAAIPILRGDPFVNPEERSPGQPLGTVTARGGHHGLVTAAWSKINGGPGDTAWHHVQEPLNTVTGRDTHGLVLLPWVDQWRSEPALITEPLAALTTHMRHSLASLEPFEGEISDELVAEVRFRMFKPDPELRRGMAFGDDYILIGNPTQMTAGLGAAVTPPVSKWITLQCLKTLGDGATNRTAA